MPFPKCKVRFHSSFGSCQREISTEDPVTHDVLVSRQDCNQSLPESELFDIQNQIKAGVTLNEVNTKVLGSGIDVQSLGEAIETVNKKITSVDKTENNK